jgi:outer membrane lipoprotein carrier protein
MSMRTWLSIFGLALVAVSSAPLAAQDAGPEVVAARVRGFYRGVPSVRSRFTQHYWSAAMRRSVRSSRGSLSVRRPDLFRFDYESGLVLASEGSDRVIQFEPGEGSEPGQYFRGESDAIGRIAGLLTGSGDLTERYRVRFPAHLYGDAPPAETDVLELAPRSDDPHVRRIWLFVSHRAGMEGVVQRVSIEDPEGNWNHYHFESFAFDAIDPAAFVFTPPADARELSR